jgi:Mg-chelatase subunit ChlD
MTPFVAFITAHWFAVLLLALAVLPAVFAVRSLMRGSLSLGWLLPAAGLALAGAGGLALHPDWGFWVAVGAAAAFFVMFVVLILTSRWVLPLAYVVGAALAFGLGGLTSLAAGEGLIEAGRTLASLEPAQPWWLLLLLLVPLIFWFSYRSLAGLGPVRRWVALGLRCLLITLLALALAELRIKHQNDTVTVLFLVDRSLSVPQEPDPSDKTIDLRWLRVKKFINQAVEDRGSGHERDKAGLIVFAKRPRLELPPSDAPRFKFREFASTVDGNYTDIGAAIKLALASFPEGSGKRVVLISDGNENLGNAEEQARIAKQNGVQIDVVPLGAGQRNENEVLVERVEAPPVAEQGARLPIRVLLRNYNPNPVIGELTVRQIVEGVGTPIDKQKVKLAPGLTTVTIKQALRGGKDESYTYEAEFVPEGVVVGTDKGQHLEPLVGDRVQNNKATTHVVARGRRRVLFLEGHKGEHAYLVDELRSRKFDIVERKVDAPEDLPKDKDRLTVLLSNFDCVVLANVAADALTEEQQEAIRSNTHEQGCGLIMLGGPDGFGAGGWQNTAVEKALPVESDIKALKVQGKGGLVMIMHASEMAEGNFWQKKIAKLAMDKLSTVDEVGILHFDWGGMKWHIPLQEIGEKRDWLKRQVDKLVPGDMPDFTPGLQLAHAALMEKDRDLTVRHIIIISDGDPGAPPDALLRQMRKDKVTVSTVGVATHGAALDQRMAHIATTTGGRYHKVTSANQLPAIYIKETRLVSQSFVYEKKFQPRAVPLPGGPTENLGAVPPLFGFVRTTPKQSPLVGIPIESPQFNGQVFPILAYWQYGLGKSVAFTSSPGVRPEKLRWDPDWAKSDMYLKFWEQVVTWALRPTESKNFVMTMEPRDGKVKVTIDARDPNNQPLIDLNLRGRVTTPSGKPEAQGKLDLEFKQTNSGVYEAEFKADEAGSYFVNVQAWGVAKDKNGKVVLGKDGKPVEEAKDSVRAGMTIPYSPEYSDLETNTALLERLRALTDGETYADDAESLDKAAARGEVFRKAPAFSKNLQPVWYWLLFLTGTLLLFDVATRRISLEFGAVTAAAVAAWDRQRGRTAAAAREPEYIDRLKARKAQVGEAIDQGKKAARRFEGGEAPAAAPPPGADEAAARPAAAPRPAAPRPKPAAEGGQEGDYLSRLKKAKKRAMEERDKEKDEE